MHLNWGSHICAGPKARWAERCSTSEKTSHEQAASGAIRLHKWLPRPFPWTRDRSGCTRAFPPFHPLLVSHPCFAVPQACFEQRSPVARPLVSTKRWSCETTTSRVSSEKVGGCLPCTPSPGLPPPEGAARPLVWRGCVPLPPGRPQRHRPSVKWKIGPQSSLALSRSQSLYRSSTSLSLSTLLFASPSLSVSLSLFLCLFPSLGVLQAVDHINSTVAPALVGSVRISLCSPLSNAYSGPSLSPCLCFWLSSSHWVNRHCDALCQPGHTPPALHVCTCPQRPFRWAEGI